MLTDFAFPDTPGTASHCKIITENRTNTFYGLEVVSPCRDEPINITISEHTLEAIGYLFGFEIVKALLPDKYSGMDRLI